MADLRAELAASRGKPIAFVFAGQEIRAFEGETIAAALWAHGVRTLRRSIARGEPRGVYCNMGVCFDCLVLVKGRAVRACMTPVANGMSVEPAG